MSGLIRLGESVFPFLMDIVWQATALIVLFFVLARVFRKRHLTTRYWLWVYCLVGLLILPALSLVARDHRLALLPAKEGPVVSRGASDVPEPTSGVIDSSAVAETDDQTFPAEMTPAALPAEKPQEEAPAIHVAEVGSAAKASPTAPYSGAQSVRGRTAGRTASTFAWRGWISLAWLAGCTIFLMRLLFAALCIVRLRRSCSPVDDLALSEVFEAAKKAAGFRRGAAIRIGKRVTSPVSVGIFRPTILLPESLVKEMPLEHLRPILLHELAHIRWGDYAVNILQRLSEALFFFHPLIYLMNRGLRRLREEICDNWVLNHFPNSTVYARALTALAERCLCPKRSLVGVGLFHGTARLRGRIERILASGGIPSMTLRFRTAMTLLLVSLLAVGSLSLTTLTARAVQAGKKPLDARSENMPGEPGIEVGPAVSDTRIGVPDDLPGAREMLSEYGQEAARFFEVWQTFTPEQKQIYRIRKRLAGQISIEERDRLLAELNGLEGNVEKGSPAPHAREPAEIIIDFTTGGKLIVNRIEKSTEELNRMLKTIADVYPDVHINLMAGPESPYRNIANALVACKKAGLSNVSFTVTEERAATAEEIIAFFEEKVKEYWVKVTASSEALQAFKAEHIMELPGSEFSYSAELRRLRDLLAEADAELSDAETARREIEKQLLEVEPTMVTETVVQPNPVIAQYKAQLDKLEQELAALRKTFADAHPKVRRNKEEIQSLKSLMEKAAEKVIAKETRQANPLYVSLQHDLKKAEVQIASAKGRKELLLARIDECEKRLKEVPVLEKQFAKLVEDEGTNRKLLEHFTMELQKAVIEAERKDISPPESPRAAAFSGAGLEGPFIYVEGEVNKPGIYSFSGKGEATLYRAIIMAGGFTPYARKKKVVLITTDDAGEKKRTEFDVSEIIKNPECDPLVKDDDIIHVPGLSWSL